MEAKGIVLPPAPKPAANYNITCQANGNMLYISGHLPLLDDGTLMTGTAGKDGVDIEHGYKAARQCGLNIVATLKNHLGDLDRVEQVVKVRCCWYIERFLLTGKTQPGSYGAICLTNTLHGLAAYHYSR